MREGNDLIGWGMASSVYPVHRTAAAARARIHRDGSILVESGTQDLGTGTYTVMTQVAADAMGVPVSQVTFRLGDTQEAEAPVAAGSQTATSVGSAVNAAAAALRQKLAELAGSDPTRPCMAQLPGTLLKGDTLAPAVDRRMERLASLLDRRRRSMSKRRPAQNPGRTGSLLDVRFRRAVCRSSSRCCAWANARLTYGGVFGAGRILNPRTARSQFIGGMVWGIGLALYEDAVMDSRLGRFVNNNLAEYHIPSMPMYLRSRRSGWMKSTPTSIRWG